MLSRSADALFWLNRYIERSEGLLRALHTTYVLSLDKGSNTDNSWNIMMNVYSGLGDDEKHRLEQDPALVLDHLLLDTANPNSLKMILGRARENARGMQDHITKEVWEQVNFLYHRINSKTLNEQLQTGNEIAVIENLLKNCLLYTGIVDSTMSRGMAWNFMNLGKYIERCLNTLYLVEKTVVGKDLSEEKDILYWRALLFSLSGYEFHLKNYRSQEANYNVVHQVILNGLFPHSAYYCLERIRKYLQNVVDENDPADRGGLIRQYGRIASAVEFADVDTIRNAGVPAYLARLRADLLQFSWNLAQTYFSYS